jgi:hypothetical protein
MVIENYQKKVMGNVGLGDCNKISIFNKFI